MFKEIKFGIITPGPEVTRFIKDKEKEAIAKGEDTEVAILKELVAATKDGTLSELIKSDTRNVRNIDSSRD